VNDLQRLLIEKIASGLQKKAITSCSKWTETYRYMPGPKKWTFDRTPWTRALHDCNDEMLVGQKAAQMGFTEMCLNRCFYAIDVEGKSVVYILPTEGDSSDFSTSRFDPALELSPYLGELFSDVKNIGLKRAGGCCLFVRGSRSKSKLKSIPCGQMFFDEVDEMDASNITLAFERMAGQAARQAWLISTPTIEGKGINRFYNNSTQEHFFFRCPSCQRQTELTFPDCINIPTDDPNDKALLDTNIKCKECQGIIPHGAKSDIFRKGEWVPSHPDRLTRGFHINQLYSCTLEPWKLAQLYLTSKTNPADEQEFYNSKLGLTHAVEGAQLSEKDVEACKGDYLSQDCSPPNSFVTMGVDVGTWLHFTVNQYVFRNDRLTHDINLLTDCRVLVAGKVKDFAELDALMHRYNISSCVIDNQPETRAALDLARRFYGRVKLCIYGNGVSGKEVRIHEEMEHKVTVDRTSWLDMSLGRFRNGTITIPKDTTQEYIAHMTALVRMYKKDKNGNPYGVYENAKDDHFAHANNYAEIALQIGASFFSSQDTESPL